VVSEKYSIGEMVKYPEDFTTALVPCKGSDCSRGKVAGVSKYAEPGNIAGVTCSNPGASPAVVVLVADLVVDG